MSEDEAQQKKRSREEPDYRGANGEKDLRKKEESGMEEAENIVAMLNGPPLDLSITVFDFCQKSPSELRQLLFYVLSAIVPPQRIEDSSDSTTCWIMETLILLNYRSNLDEALFREGIATGNTNVVRLVLVWLLPQISVLQKRAYLAQFLMDIEIPAELLLSEEINKLHGQYDALKEHFKATHRHLESLRQIKRDPVKLKEQVLELETERENLSSKVSKLKGRLQDMDKSDELLQAIRELRSQKVLETKLATSMNEQRQALICTIDMHQKAFSKLQEMKAVLDEANHSSFFDKRSQEISALHVKTKQRLPEEIATKQVRLCAVTKVLSGPDKSEGLAGIQAQLLAITEELKVLKRQNDPKNEKTSKRESMYLQQAQMGIFVANMSRAANDKVAILKEYKSKLQRDLDQRLMTIDEVKVIVPRGEDFKNYVDALRAKSATYKQMKKEIDDLDFEHGALLNSQELLEQKANLHPPLSTDNAHEASKHKSLKGLSKMVEEVNSLIKDIRSQLTPKVKELKLVKADLQALDVEQAEKKRHYTDICSFFERKVSKLEAELAISYKEYEDKKQKLKEILQSIEELQLSQSQINIEKENGSVSAKLNFKIEQQQELQEAIQIKQHKLKETEHVNSIQMVKMKDVLTLLAAKLSLYSSTSRPAIFSSATSLDTGDGVFS